jgi:hypothetical protein
VVASWIGKSNRRATSIVSPADGLKISWGVGLLSGTGECRENQNRRRRLDQRRVGDALAPAFAKSNSAGSKLTLKDRPVLADHQIVSSGPPVSSDAKV